MNKGYYRSQLIPNDINTTVYWVEDGNGKASDILPENIPDGIVVEDVTYPCQKRKIRKQNKTFVTA